MRRPSGTSSLSSPKARAIKRATTLQCQSHQISQEQPALTVDSLPVNPESNVRRALARFGLHSEQEVRLTTVCMHAFAHLLADLALRWRRPNLAAGGQAHRRGPAPERLHRAFSAR
jgi:hypothetical protein